MVNDFTRLLDYDVRIRTVRRGFGMSQAWFTELVGAARKAVVYQWESRKRCPSPVFWQHCRVDVERTGFAANEAMTQTSDSDTRHLTPDPEGTGAQQAMVDGSQ